MRFGQWGVFALTAMCALATSAGAQVASKIPLAVGPFTIGMSLAELRAAAPQAVWEDKKSLLTNKVIGLRGYNAMQIGAWTFSVEATPGYYSAYELKLDGFAPAQSRKQCREQ